MLKVKESPKAKTLEQKDIFKAIHRSQHCQRNWDLDQTIPQSDIDLILESVTQCPSKQNQSFYKVHVLQDRDTIEMVHELTKGFGISNELTTTNTQTLANMVLVFEASTSERTVQMAYVNRYTCDPDVNVHEIDWHNHEWDQNLLESCRQEIQKDEHMAVGLAAGYCNITASLLGYSTGCCACYDPGTMQKALGLKGNPLLIMGVGIAGSQNRRVHHLDNTIKFPTKKKQDIEVIYH
jgi:nitroreductase